MKSLRYTPFTAAITMCALLACGDDDPSVPESPCVHGNTRCVEIKVDGDMAASESFTSVDGGAYFVGKWPVDGKLVAGYDANRRMVITLWFSEPLIARVDIEGIYLALRANTPQEQCVDRWVRPAVDVSVNGSWSMFHSVAHLSGNCSANEPSLETSVVFNAVAGQVLRSVQWSFTVPETYAVGAGAGSPIVGTDLPVSFIGWYITVPGDQRGNPPVSLEPRPN